MAEAIALRDFADVIEPLSAGLYSLGSVPPLTKQTLAANGCSIIDLNSKPISREVWDTADIVINMSGIAKNRAFTNCLKVEDWEVQDPYGADSELYQKIFVEIEGRVAMLAGRLRSTQVSSSKTS